MSAVLEFDDITSELKELFSRIESLESSIDMFDDIVRRRIDLEETV